MISIFFGEVNRTSPEAPVPVVEKKSESFRMGGAANVAANLIGLGIKTILSGVVGNDQNGEALKRLLKKNNISQQGLIKSTLSTTTKTRIIAVINKLLESMTKIPIFLYQQIKSKKY